MDKPTLPNEYGADGEDQVIINSGRVLFNAKSDFLMGFADKGISFSTNGGFHVNGGDLTHINTKKIYLGLNAEDKGQPVLMGDDTEKWLKDLTTLLGDILNAWQTQIGPVMWPPGGGAALVPATLVPFVARLKLLEQQIEPIKSKSIFLIK